MAKKATARTRRKQKSGGSGAATFILLAAIGAGLFIGLAGFEAGSAVGEAARAAEASS